MKGWYLCTYIIFLSWKFLNCEESESDAGLIVNFTEHDLHEDMIDPFSFDYDRTNKKMVHDQNKNTLRSETPYPKNDLCHIELRECQDALGNDKSNEIFIRRIINLLISNANLKGEDDLLSGSISLTLSQEQMEVLRKFGDHKVTMRQVDAILTDAIRPPPIDVLTETMTLIDHILIKLHRHARWVTPIAATILICLVIRYVNWSTGKVIIALFAVACVYTFFVTWSQLIKDAERKHYTTLHKHQQPPIQCNPEKMSLWQSLKTYFNGEDECYEYYKAIDFDPWLAVTPLQVIVTIIENLVMQPIPKAGTVIGSFIDNSTKPLVWPLNWFVTILLYVFVCCLILWLLVIIFGARISIGYLFGNISLSGRQSTSNKRQSTIESREPITVILQVTSDTTIKQLQPSIANSAQVHSRAAISDDSAHERIIAEDAPATTTCKNCNDGCCSNNLNTKKMLDEQQKSMKNPIIREEMGDGDR